MEKYLPRYSYQLVCLSFPIPLNRSLFRSELYQVATGMIKSSEGVAGDSMGTCCRMYWESIYRIWWVLNDHKSLDSGFKVEARNSWIHNMIPEEVDFGIAR